MGGEVVVEGYADLVSDPKLRGDDPDVIARELQQLDSLSDSLVAWLPTWLIAEKNLEPVGRSDHVVSGRVDHETEKAYLLKSGRDEAWLPKSVIRVFRPGSGAELSIPQHGLLDYAGDGGGR